MQQDSVSSQFKPPLPNVTPEWQDTVSMLHGISLGPFIGKCLYVIGTIRHLMGAANKLFPTDGEDYDYSLPAFILACSATELLGLCLLGHSKIKEGSATGRLNRGFKYIAKASLSKNPQELSLFNGEKYKIPQELTNLRRFGVHGIAGSDTDLKISRELVGWLWGAIGNALDDYYDELKQDKPKIREHMARAYVKPLIYEKRPTRIVPTYKHLKAGLRPAQLPEGDRWVWQDTYERIKAINSR